MGANVDVFGVLQKDLPGAVQQEADALGKGGVRGSRTVVHGKLPILIFPNLKLEALLQGPTLQRRRVIEAYANNLYIQCLKLFVEVAVPATFDRSAIGPGRWEKPQSRSDTLQVVRSARAAIGIGGGELGTRNRVFGGDTVERCDIPRINGVTAVLSGGVRVGIRCRTVLRVGVAGCVAACAAEREEADEKRGESH